MRPLTWAIYLTLYCVWTGLFGANQVQNSLLDLLRDPNGNFRVKIAAAAAYMYYPSVEVLTKIRFIITKETNVQVRQFLISTLQTMATTHNPTTQHL